MAALPPDEVAFTARIQDLGLTAVQAARFNAQDLTLIRKESLKDSFTANNMPSVMIMMRLMALRTWTIRRANEFGRNNLDINDFTDEVCLKEQEKCTVKRKSDAISDSSGDKSKDFVGLVVHMPVVLLKHFTFERRVLNPAR
jgi:hypothetical protein